MPKPIFDSIILDSICRTEEEDIVAQVELTV